MTRRAGVAARHPRPVSAHGVVARRARLASLVVLTVGAAIAGCRGAPAAPAPAPVTPDAPPRATAPADPGRAVVRGDADATWRALLAAYADLAIPVGARDSAARRVASAGWRGHRAVGRIALRAAVDCGSDRMGPRADTYAVALEVESRVSAGDSAGTSVVTTTVRGTGTPVSFQGPPVPCTSKGGIERALHDAVAGRLASR